MTPVSSHSPHGSQSTLQTVHVLGGGSAGSSAHVRALAAGLVARGVRVTVCAPSEADRRYDFTGAGARYIPVPRSTDPVAVAALRTACADADLVHAHGLHASFRTVLALTGRATPLVVTWHSAADAPGARGHFLRVLERRVARAASVVLGVSSQLVDRARRSGARDARLSAVAAPRGSRARAVADHAGTVHAAAEQAGTDPTGVDTDTRCAKLRAELGATGRPLLIAAGPSASASASDEVHETLLTAARSWRALDPVPLAVVVGEGRPPVWLRSRIEDEDLPVRLLDRHDDVTGLLAAADLALLPAASEPRPLLAQEALHARVPLITADTGYVRELVGDAAEFVPYGDAQALADAVARLLADPERRERLGQLGARQAAGWPSEDDNVAQVLSIYDELTRPEIL